MSFKTTINRIISKISPSGKLSFTLSYFHNRHRFPNLKQPEDLSEIWIKKVLDGEINKISYLADKYAVREYIANCGMSHLLPQLYGAFSNEETIDFDSFPTKFALKANWGAGKNIICTNKESLDIAECRQKIRDWFNSHNYSYTEKHYDCIPRKVICEEFIDDGSGGFPTDYKFMCIHGKVHCILVCSGRDNEKATYLPYSIDWKPLYNYYRNVNHSINLAQRPNNLQQMIEIAEKLAKISNLIRVDLYSNGNTIWFGEITLTPAGCIFHRWSDYAIREMGRIYREELQRTKATNID